MCRRQIPTCMPLLLVTLLLAACGGGGGGGGAPPDDVAPLLAGAADSLAIDALPAVDPVPAAAADEAGDFLLTRIDVTVADGATVTQFNAAAAAVGATGFADARPGSPFLTLIVPRQAGSAELVLLAERLGDQPGIASASAGRQATETLLPGDEVKAPPELMSHLLPTRFPAAWNAAFSADGEFNPPASDCVSDAADTVVMIVDRFQTRPANAGDELQPFTGAQQFGVHRSGPSTHGWEVAAALASDFDENRPTGALAAITCVSFVLVDHTGLTNMQIPRLVAKVIEAQPASARLIINMSYGFPISYCGPAGKDDCTPANLPTTSARRRQQHTADRVEGAIVWAEEVGPALDDRVLLVPSAGNKANEQLAPLIPGIAQARFNSAPALAPQLASLEQLFSPGSPTARQLWGDPEGPDPDRSMTMSVAEFQRLQALSAKRLARIPDGRNMLIVGASTAADLAENVVEAEFSNHDPDVTAVGKGIVSFDLDTIKGTSFAAPQVAALAAWLWAISDLEDQPTPATARLIRGTAFPVAGLRLIDAYEATLALDARPGASGSPIRKGLLDVTGDDAFSVPDLQRFAAAYGLDDPSTPSIPSVRNYDRFDLNGDDFTGGIIFARFDLDHAGLGSDGAAQYGLVEREIEGYTIGFNEVALSDLQILCFYAYSELFADGNPTPDEVAARTDILGPARCVGARMNLGFPIAVQDSAPLTVSVEVPAGGGAFVPAPGLQLTLTPTCGTVAAATGQTDAAGQFATTVTPGAGCSSVSVAVIARGTAEGKPLAEQVVTATVSGGSGSAVSIVTVQTGRTPGMIEAFVAPLGFSLPPEPTVSAPIGDAAGFVSQLLAAIGDVAEIGSVNFSLAEPVSLTLDLGVPVAEVNLFASAGGCASSVSLTVGAVRENRDVSFGSGRLSIGGCLAEATIIAGDIEDGVQINGTQGDVTLRANRVGQRVAIAGTAGAPAQSRTIEIIASTIDSLLIANTIDSTVSVQGTVQRHPDNIIAALNINSNRNLSLGPVSGGVLNLVEIVSTTFLSPPSIALGNIVLPNGDLRIVDNEGFELSSFALGSTIEGDLVITGNQGFGNTDATAFAEGRTIGGTVSISGNAP